MSLKESIGAALAVDTSTGDDASLNRKKRVRRRKEENAKLMVDDKLAVLRELVGRHRNMVRAAARMVQPTKDRNFGDGTVVKSNYDPEAAADLEAAADVQKKHAARIASQMTKLLNGMPIYDLFLKHIYGIGPVVAANMIASIDVSKAPKVSNLRRYCGLAVIGGRLERLTSAPKAQGGDGSFNESIRTALFQGFASMAMGAGTKRKNDKYTTSKYVQIWDDYLHRMAHSERVSHTGTIVPIGRDGAKPVSAGKFVRSAGWHKAADVFVEDYYTVARAIAGLPVWPSYHAAKLGYSHGGKVCVNEPRMLTVDEALALVGNVGGVPCDRKPLLGLGAIKDESELLHVSDNDVLDMAAE